MSFVRRSNSSRVAAPISYGTATRFKKAKPTVVERSECLGPINTVNGFNVSINAQPAGPALSTFDWLSNLAVNFQAYRWLSFRVRYVSQCSTTAVGSVALAYQHSVTVAAPTDYAGFVTLDGAVTANLWEDASITIPVKTLQELKHYEISPVAGTEDDTLFFPFAFSVATQGQSSLSSVGNVWVDYAVELLEPTTDFHNARAWGANYTFSSSASIQDIWAGNFAAALSGSGDFVTFTSTTTTARWYLGGTGRFVLVATIYGTTSSTTQPSYTFSITNGSGGSTIAYSSDFGHNVAETWSSGVYDTWAGAATVDVSYLINTTAPSITLTWSGSSTSLAAGYCVVQVYEVPVLLGDTSLAVLRLSKKSATAKRIVAAEVAIVEKGTHKRDMAWSFDEDDVGEAPVDSEQAREKLRPTKAKAADEDTKDEGELSDEQEAPHLQDRADRRRAPRVLAIRDDHYDTTVKAADSSLSSSSARTRK